VQRRLPYSQRIDWTVFHFLNGSLRGHPLVSDEVGDFVTFWAVPAFAIATCGLWFFDRPGPWYRWKVACFAGMTAAGLGLLAGQVVSHLWVRERPFVSHPSQTLLLVPPSHEPSFPSDHAIAAFAIATAVALIGGRVAGALFLSAATVIALSRVFVGLHYPGDVLGGAVIGALAALVVFRFSDGRWVPAVRLLSRLTDPLVAPAWRALDGYKARRRARSHLTAR
jgi:undecaprenyl-diphosphatase